MRIVIVSVSAGAGHVRAGAPLEEATHLVAPGTEVHHVDILEHTGRACKKAYAGGFLEVVSRSPTVWEVLYEASDRLRRMAIAARAAGRPQAALDIVGAVLGDLA
jgi:processive 1,2-diacylglycerol beta-glucosyltransferase